MMRARLFMLLLFILLFSISAIGQEENEKPKAQGSKEAKKEPKSNFSFEVSWQNYHFNDDIYEDVFDRKDIQGVGFSFGWYPVKNLELASKLGYITKKGKIYIKSGDEGKQEEKFLFTLVPIQLELSYRFDFIEEQLIVPSIGIGYDWWYYQQNFGGDEIDDEKGNRSGYHYHAGLAILLDKLDPSGNFFLQRDFGIENVFLNLDFLSPSFKKQNEEILDLNGYRYSIGLLFEF